MLVVGRRENEGIRIGDDITISVARIEDGRVRIAIDAPAGMPVVREELLESTERNGRALIAAYREKRRERRDYRLTNAISLAADMLIKLAAGAYEPQQTEDVWEIVEALITRYAEGRRDETRE